MDFYTKIALENIAEIRENLKQIEEYYQSNPGDGIFYLLKNTKKGLNKAIKLNKIIN